MMFRGTQVVDPALNSIKEALPGLLLASKSENTISAYKRGIKSWQYWCAKFPELQPFPAKATSVMFFITSMVQRGESLSKTIQTFYSINFLHNITGTKNPCKNKTVKAALESARRILSKPVKKKEPIKPKHIRQLVKILAVDAKNLPNYRILAICTLAFAGFFRFSEVANLRRSDIVFHRNYLKIFIEKSETDLYRDGAHVLVAKTGSISCPYSILSKYIELAGISSSSQEFLFRGLTFFKKQKVYKLRTSNKPISYSRAREIVLDAFDKVGLDKKKFCLHNLRAGGATAAANTGIRDRLFKRHGRWRSENAKDGYVKDKLSSLSRNLV